MRDTGLFPLLRNRSASARIVERGVSIGMAGTTAASRTYLFKVNL
jgi:hypothetical protein